MKPLIIYHAACADGFGAAFAAWLKFGDDAEYLPMAYGDSDTQWGKLANVPYKTRDVYIVDFSLPRDLMDDIFRKGNKVVWLDHHKTAFEQECGGLDSPLVKDGRYEVRETVPDEDALHVILDNNQSGAMLAWRYFHPDATVPVMIQHIDDRDRWQFKIPGSKEFNAALWAYAPWTFEQWSNLNFSIENDGPTYQTILAEGAAILRAHDQNVQSTLRGGQMPCRIEYNEKLVPSDDQPDEIRFYEFARGLAANCPPHLSSDVGHELANLSGTFGLLWCLDKSGKVKCSLRSNGDYDVSAIAKALGGGGHKNAAGFETDMDTLMGWLGA